MPRRIFTSPLLLVLVSGCSAILPPKEEDDGVQRCDNTADCKAFSDNRLQPVCVQGEDQGDNSPKVCVSEFKGDVRCGPDFYADDHPLVLAYQEAQSSDAYTPCTENNGEFLCPPVIGSGCTGGLVNEGGICNDPDLDPPAVIGNAATRGQDVLDQFCRWYFCSDDFVCDIGNSGGTCVPCNAGEPFGEGGCGTLYVGSEPSTVYRDLGDNSACGSTPVTDGGGLGPVP